MQLCGSLSILLQCFSLRLEWSLTLFQSCGHCWVFQICWHIECSTFTASSFRIWNSSTGIPSPPLALFGMMLPKSHLTSHSRMSGSWWVITPSWLSGSYLLGFGQIRVFSLVKHSKELFNTVSIFASMLLIVKMNSIKWFIYKCSRLKINGTCIFIK